MSMRNPLYEAALRASLIEHGLRGLYDPAAAHLTPDTVLYSVWREAVLKLMAENERNLFLALPDAEQRAHLATGSFFGFEQFRAEFLTLALASEKSRNPRALN